MKNHQLSLLHQNFYASQILKLFRWKITDFLLYVTLLQQLLPVPKGPIKEAMAVLDTVLFFHHLHYDLETLT